MKSTYKILGVIYDKIPEAVSDYIASSYNNAVLDISIEKNLFDFNKYVRKINLSFLFSIESKENLDLILDKVCKLDNVILVIDVFSKNQIISAFITKRIKQILWLLENKCKNVELVI